MKASHIHLGVRDFEGAIAWMRDILQIEAKYRNQGMGVFDLGSFTLILDQSDVDSEATIALDSQNCKTDFARLTSQGAEPLEAPSKKPWGVVVGYLKGPGKISVEIEEVTS